MDEPLEKLGWLRTELEVASQGVTLRGNLGLPPDARGVVLFAHGSGSSRLSLRSRLLASEFESRGLGTLLVDLLTEAEDADEKLSGKLRADLPLLASRLVDCIDWLAADGRTSRLRIGLIGSSAGVAAALQAAATRPEVVGAVVLRGGRPDLAISALPRVWAPTLVLVGGADSGALELNRTAVSLLAGESRLEVIRGAGHLLDEPAALDQVALLAGQWFEAWLPPGGAERAAPLGAGAPGHAP